MRDKPRVSLLDYERIRALAQQYILHGGGVVIGATDEGDMDAHVHQIADSCFNAKTDVDWLSAKLAEHVQDQAAREDISSAAQVVIDAYSFASFHFGTAVGVQIVVPQSSTPTQSQRTRDREPLNPRTQATMKLRGAYRRRAVTR